MIVGRLARSSGELRRALGWALVAGLSIAALTAAAAVVDGSFDEADARVIGSSLGFAVFSAIGAAGASLRLRRRDRRAQSLGAATAAAATAAFVLLLVAIWVDPDGDGAWQAWGIAALLSLGTSHASLMIGVRQPEDPPVVRLCTLVSLVTGAVDTSIAVLLVADAIHEGPPELFALLVIALVFSTALTPILRRLVAAPRATPSSDGLGALREVAAELLDIAARVEALAEADGVRTAELRRHADGLRASARQL